MNVETVDYISEYCKNAFLRSPKSKELLVFLPSVNGKAIYPYYPRRSWGDELVKNYNVLYISDPYQPLSQYQEPMGSWFISPNGQSTLNILAEKISILKNEIGARKIVFYGSSMGGYAAVMLSTFIKGSKAIAECPQLYLKKHPGSRFVCENILSSEISISEIDPISYVVSGKQSHIHLICSVRDRHYSQHVLPFIEDLSNISAGINFKLTVNLYFDASYKNGHVALRKEHAVPIINEIFEF